MQSVVSGHCPSYRRLVGKLMQWLSADLHNSYLKLFRLTCIICVITSFFSNSHSIQKASRIANLYIDLLPNRLLTNCASRGGEMVLHGGGGGCM